jgi:c-di-GMP-binding flagellar brake protein YcgR
MQISLAATYEVIGPEHVRDILGGKEYDARTLDLSAGGLSLVADHYLPVGTELIITIALFETNLIDTFQAFEPLKVYGTIRSMLPQNGNQYRIGVEFTAVGEKESVRITHMISSPLKTSSDVYELSSN